MKEVFTIKIGTKKKKILISLAKGKTMWHTGKYTLMIAKMKWLDSLNEWGMYWWTFIPIRVNGKDKNRGCFGRLLSRLKVSGLEMYKL